MYECYWMQSWYNKCPMVSDKQQSLKVTTITQILLPYSNDQALISYQSVLIHCSNNVRPLWSRRTTSSGVSSRQARLMTRRKSTESRRMIHTSIAHSRQPASINSWNRYLNTAHATYTLTPRYQQPLCHLELF